MDKKKISDKQTSKINKQKITDTENQDNQVIKIYPQISKKWLSANGFSLLSELFISDNLEEFEMSIDNIIKKLRQPIKVTFVRTVDNVDGECSFFIIEDAFHFRHPVIEILKQYFRSYDLQHMIRIENCILESIYGNISGATIKRFEKEFEEALNIYSKNMADNFKYSKSKILKTYKLMRQPILVNTHFILKNIKEEATKHSPFVLSINNIQKHPQFFTYPHIVISNNNLDNKYRLIKNLCDYKPKIEIDLIRFIGYTLLDPEWQALMAVNSLKMLDNNNVSLKPRFILPYLLDIPIIQKYIRKSFENELKPSLINRNKVSLIIFKHYISKPSNNEIFREESPVKFAQLFTGLKDFVGLYLSDTVNEYNQITDIKSIENDFDKFNKWFESTIAYIIQNYKRMTKNLNIYTYMSKKNPIYRDAYFNYTTALKTINKSNNREVE